MKRRRFLASGAIVAGSAALSGCVDHVLEQAEQQPPIFEELYDDTEQSLPVERRYDRAIEGVQEAEEATIEDHESFASSLQDHELSVDSLEEVSEGSETLLELEFTDESDTDRGVLYALGVVSGGYAALVANDASTDKLDATIHENGAGTFGTFEVESTWAEELHAGELSPDKFAGEVMHTLSSSV